MSDTQITPPPNAEVTTEQKAPQISNEDLRLVLQAEQLKREAAEKKAAELEAKLQETTASLAFLKEESEHEAKGLGRQLSMAQEQYKAAVAAVEATEKKQKLVISEAYAAYLRAWPEARNGKLTSKTDKADAPTLYAIALASMHAGMPAIKSAKDFEAELIKALGV